jgi:hypothetical protein
VIEPVELREAVRVEFEAGAARYMKAVEKNLTLGQPMSPPVR